VRPGVVTDDVDDPVLPERPPQVVQVAAEQGRPPTFLRLPLGQDDPPGPPVDAPGVPGTAGQGPSGQGAGAAAADNPVPGAKWREKFVR